VSAHDSPIVAVVVTFESEAVIERCLGSLREAAPVRGIDIRVVDNASSDDSVARAAALVGEDHVRRLSSNRGFAAGVNAVLAGFEGRWLAVVNPDVVLPPGALDALVDRLEREPRAGLVGPRVRDPRGAIEESVGWFPTLARERAHAFYLDVLLGYKGRRRRAFPAVAEAVEWISGCAWVLRGDAIRSVGALDEDYFMYFEDVDYCWRLGVAGWSVVADPGVEILHGGSVGSARSHELPADGSGAPVLRFFGKFRPGTRSEDVMAVLMAGWRVRRALHAAAGWLGDSRARMRERRYVTAIATASRSRVN
jgi:N-acetylglucosaminyl-diphospho-decaprenol L-rhamnosyltransferase